MLINEKPKQLIPPNAAGWSHTVRLGDVIRIDVEGGDGFWVQTHKLKTITDSHQHLVLAANSDKRFCPLTQGSIDSADLTSAGGSSVVSPAAAVGVDFIAAGSPGTGPLREVPNVGLTYGYQPFGNARRRGPPTQHLRSPFWDANCRCQQFQSAEKCIRQEPEPTRTILPMVPKNASKDSEGGSGDFNPADLAEEGKLDARGKKTLLKNMNIPWTGLSGFFILVLAMVVVPGGRDGNDKFCIEIAAS
ncbi:uncharacterized protein EV422DRAFT_612635 [Fimicolochytrium jonesii]|uniref:uncharacterized protein n=1 Tax=Fimicolochytrium jonesii TaxID=1396493 RepID=UPI0022FEC83F|nr:uncharacterized protein EV422DRAFT_612635 [Fimicolochytrium jonesii]KAI8815525.1 hypothetical protein EV422DRAFT_612635 [Fimicolochytrium jonesii]